MKKNINKFREWSSSFFRRKKEGEKDDSSKRVISWIVFIIFTFLTTLLISYRGGKIPTVMKVGQIAPYDIKADRDYEIVDEEATAKFRAEALKNVKSTYTFDPYLGVGIADRIKAAFTEMRRLLTIYSEMLQDSGEKITFKDMNEDQLKELRNTWEKIVGVTLTDRDWKFLVESEFSTAVQKKMCDLVVLVMSNPIVADRISMLEDKERGIAIRRLPATGETEKIQEEDWDSRKVEAAMTAEEIKKELLKGRYLVGVANINDPGDRAIINIVGSLLQSNVIFDAQETEARRQTTLKDIKSVVINIQSGESIIRGGSRYEPWHLKVLEGIRKEKSARSMPLEMVGYFILIFTVYHIVYVFGRRYVRKFDPGKVDLVFMGVLLLLMLLMLRVSLFLDSAIYGLGVADIPRMALAYVIPMAAAAMLVRFVINSETAILFSIVLASFTGIVVHGNVYFTAYTLISSLIAACSIAHADKRSAIFQAGVITGFVNAVLVLGIHFINAASVIEPLSLNNVLWYELCAFANGIFCSVFVMVLAPVVESAFGYTTDIKLLELANLNHPLLRELIIRAPGTYHHSHLIGILAETAAEAVGANPLLARVGAYYHDIGKMKKPMYFTENMPEGMNIHESLSPHMSSLIISSHVKEGLELAKMYKLPAVITAMIPEHHGTKRISYFYEKARKSTDPALQKIEEKDFKYPGPKPQSRESAILMLADGAEAAVRSIKEKTPPRIQQVVESIIDKSFIEGQLSECELTLKALNEIAKAFTRILISIYHQRIEYPKETLDRRDDEISVFEEENGNSDPDA